jgi:integrase
MTTTPLVPSPVGSSAITPSRILAAARDYVEAAKAPNTRRSYRAQWSTFSRWCDAHARAPLPAEPSTLALYLGERAQTGRKVATLGLALSAIRAAHRDAGHPDPAAVPEVRSIWEGIRRTHGTAQRRATPLTAASIRAVVASLPSGTPRGARDRALILLGFAGAFRRSELVALDLPDLTFDPVRGVIVTVRRSKTDQLSAGAIVAVPFASHTDLCAARALRAWIETARLTEGPVFRSVDRHHNIGARLDGRDVARIVKSSAARAGIEASCVSGHSLRAGLATTAALAGKSDRAIMAQGRWRSRTMLDRYVRTADAWRDNAADGLL